MAAGWKADYESAINDKYHYVALSGRLPVEPGADWFDAVGDHLARTTGAVTAHAEVPLDRREYRCHQWTLHTGDNTARVVRVYVIEERVYYLHVEGRNVDPSDAELVEPFFRYFEFDTPVGKPKGKAKR